MGFFVGWQFFEESERYSPRHYREMAYQRHRDGIDKARAEKRARKRQAAKKAAKRKLKEQQAREAETYQQMAYAQYGGSSDGSYGGQDLYDQFSQKGNDAYKEEISRRFGTLYSGQTDNSAPTKLGNRGLGGAAHQGVRRDRGTSFDPSSPLQKRLGVPLGRQQFNPNSQSGGAGQNSRGGGGASLGSGASQSQRARFDNSSGGTGSSGSSSGGQASGSTKLNRPF